jgi:AcrR family transcriptional regulator
MPTERFYNLPAGKKDIIREAALKEFVRVPFEKASINKIIKTAGISRGSFYTYFEDKHDVLSYIFENAAENFQSAWEESAKKNHGDLWKTIESFMDESVFNTKENFLQLVKNIVDSVQMFGVTNHLCLKISPGQFSMLSVMYQSIDQSDFKDQSIETFGMLVSMMFFEMAKGLEWYYSHPEDKEKIKKIFLKKLEIFQYGIRKQEVNL